MRKVLFLSIVFFFVYSLTAEEISPNILEMRIWQPQKNEIKRLSDYIDPSYAYVIFVYSLESCYGTTFLTFNRVLSMIERNQKLKVMVVITLSNDSLLIEYERFIKNSYLSKRAEIICSKDYSFWSDNSLQKNAPFIGFVQKGKNFYDIFYTNHFWNNTEELRKNIEATLE